MDECPRVNWEVLIRCKDCGAQFQVVKPAASLDVLEGESGKPGRLLLVGAPNACPECHNIRPVAEAEKST